MTSKQPMPFNPEQSTFGRLMVWVITIISFVVIILFWFGLRTENRYQISPSVQTLPASEHLMPSGVHPLGLGGWRWVNREFWWRDGVLVIPDSVELEKPKPLLIWLHHGGGASTRYKHLYPLAERFGLVMLLLDARHNTWDAVDNPFGADAEFINIALDHVFSKAVIDRSKIALGGLSDGGSYALALGRSNGELFTHIMAVAPLFMNPPGEQVGMPKMYVAHGTFDGGFPRYAFEITKWIIVPWLRHQGYTVDFLAFNGGHWIPTRVAEKMLHWFINES